MSDDIELDYDYLMQQALRGLMRDVIDMVARIGDAPGEHHFYIEFLTDAPGVEIPDHLKEDYPERMTIVLQHQFEELLVREESFSVTLWFKSREAKLTIPFDAVTSFADPSVQFGLRFENQNKEPDNAEKTEKEEESEKPTKEQSQAAEKTEPESDGADIVSLDAFRKK